MFKYISLALIGLGIYIGVTYNDKITDFVEGDTFEQVQDTLEDIGDSDAFQQVKDKVEEITE